MTFTVPAPRPGKRSRPGLLVLSLTVGIVLFLFTFIAPTGAGAAVADKVERSVPVTWQGLIVDEANILDTTQVEDSLNRLDVPAGVQIGVLTTNTPAVDPDDYDNTIRAYVLSMGHEPFLNGTNGGLPDQLVLVTISPDMRKLGFYGGDNTNMSRGVVSDAVEAMRGPARDGNWDQVPAAAASVLVVPDEPTTGSLQAGLLRQPLFILLGLFMLTVPGIVLGRPLVTGLKKVPSPGELRDAHTKWTRTSTLLTGVDAVRPATWHGRQDEDERAVEFFNRLAARDYTPSFFARCSEYFRDDLASYMDRAAPALVEAEKIVADLEAHLLELVRAVPDATTAWQKATALAGQVDDPTLNDLIDGGHPVAVLTSVADRSAVERLRSDRAFRTSVDRLVSRSAGIVGYVRDRVDFVTRTGSWKSQWKDLYQAKIGGPVNAATQSLRALSGQVSADKLTDADLAVRAVAGLAVNVDERVRDGSLSPVDGAVELDGLNTDLETVVKKHAKVFARGMSSSKARQVASSASRDGDDQFMNWSFPLLVGMLVASSSSSSSSPSYSSSSPSYSPTSFSSGGGFSGGSGSF